jgi:F-type H+-transporting ATPase subunit a
VVDLDPANPLPSAPVVVGFHLSITSTIITMWIVTAILIVALLLMTRGMTLVPGRLQNVAEFAYESLGNFATSLGGPAAQPYIPLFAALFLYILFSNWSGLIPPVGKLEELRAPTSDLNITLGLALFAFVVFEAEGFRVNGIRGYLSKFFPISSFKEGLGAGILGMYVGLVELLLEFIKPLTLSMRLFGNIYGGEVALGVITALALAVLPVALLGLETLLNFIQALIFSVLTLMFTLIAIEGHGHEEEHPAAEPMQAQTLDELARQGT